MCSRWGEELQKKHDILGSVHRESNNFRGGLCEGLQSVGPNATMCHCGRPRPRPEGPGTHCRPRLRTTENHMLKGENSGLGTVARRAKDAAVTGQFPCVRVFPLGRLPLSLPLSLQADVRDHVAKTNSCKRGLDMVPRNLDYGLVIVQSTDRNRSNLCNHYPPCRASLLSHPSMPK